MATHVFYLELELLLGALRGSLYPNVSPSPHPSPLSLSPYLERKVLQEVCGSVRLVRLCAAAGVDPNTDGRRLGPRGVLGSDLHTGVNCIAQSSRGVRRTVKPLLRVVDSVLEPWETGVARPLVKGDLPYLTALMAALERRAVCRFSASRREAIAIALHSGGGGIGRAVMEVMGGYGAV